MATSRYDVCMIDTPNNAFDDDKEDPVENKSPGAQSEHRRALRRSKSQRSRENNNSTREENTPNDEVPVEVGSEQEEQDGGQDSPDE